MTMAALTIPRQAEPALKFVESVTDLSITPSAYLSANPSLAGLVVSAVVLDQDNQTQRVLLIQRAATDGFPLQWECPGGGVDPTDATLLHAVRRELFEETGLVLTQVLGLLDGSTEWDTRAGRWRKLTFLVRVSGREVEGDHRPPDVVLEPNEHQEFVWATEQEVNVRKCGDGRLLKFAYEEQIKTILDAFAICSRM